MKKTFLTGIKPTGIPHIGNYFGAIKPAVDLVNSDEAEYYYFIADYHALTTVKNGVGLAESVKDIACTWLACGLDPSKVVFYRQSDVPEVFELATILSNVTPKGLMNRAHAYKAASAANTENGRDADENINMGLYCYPVLMAADIIIMDTDFVPVGLDQKQHIEIAADIVTAFNANYGKVLKSPEPCIDEAVATVPGLDGRKMSKSYGNVVPLFAPEAELRKSIMRIVTDSSAPGDPKPTDSLVFQLYKLFTGKDKTEAMRKRFTAGIGWGEAKQMLFDEANAFLLPMREKYQRLMKNFDEAEKILAAGAARARENARRTLCKVRKAVIQMPMRTGEVL